MIEQEVLNEIKRQIEACEEFHEINLVGFGRMALEWEMIFKVEIFGAPRFFSVVAEGDFDDGTDSLEFDSIVDDLKEVVRAEKVVEYWKELD